MTSCQADIDKDLGSSIDLVGQSATCCPVAKRSGFDIFGLVGKRQGSTKNCGPDPDYPNNPPTGGKNHHEVFECDYDKWPNVCGNAQSAIVSRGKSPILTYAGPNARTGAMKKITNPWYASKWESGSDPEIDKTTQKPIKTPGWGLTGCRVEEYPWGSGAPNRNPDLKKWDEHKPTGTSDADFFIDPSKRAEAEAKNICAIPYGVHFLFVNYVSMNAGARNYDPWWDDKLFEKTVNIVTDNKGVTLATEVAKTVSHYCRYPSPGKLSWNPDNNKWEKYSPATSSDRKRHKSYYKCDLPRLQWSRGDEEAQEAWASLPR
ncbi:hypothetical protein FJTKL_08773 [Diaporthe vaccinii]|uniref:Uncharacterized protein n=1 Tax=Diaporthe vaccinii TaxID=105482 RepID=A0ABR4EQG9_9PEZI